MALVSTVILALLLTLQMPMSVLVAPSAFRQAWERSLTSLQKSEQGWEKRFRLAGIATRAVYRSHVGHCTSEEVCEVVAGAGVGRRICYDDTIFAASTLSLGGRNHENPDSKNFDEFIILGRDHSFHCVI